MNLSLVVTVLNEENNIANLIDSILRQSQNPDEFIIVDGGSRDRTLEIIEKYTTEFENRGISYKILKNDKINIARGRNIGIRLANSKAILVTDGGCILDQNWIKRISKPILEDGIDFVGGFFKPVSINSFQNVLVSLTTAEKPTKNFLPSSRSVAFTKELWTKVGGYPEFIDWGEDTLFNKRCINSGASYAIAEDAIVYWEVRRNLKDTFKQYYRYSFGDGVVLRINKSHIYTILMVIAFILSLIAKEFLVSVIILFFFPLLFIIKHKIKFSLHFIIRAYILIYVIYFARLLGLIKGLFTKVKQ